MEILLDKRLQSMVNDYVPQGEILDGICPDSTPEDNGDPAVSGDGDLLGKAQKGRTGNAGQGTGDQDSMILDPAVIDLDGGLVQILTLPFVQLQPPEPDIPVIVRRCPAG